MRDEIVARAPGKAILFGEHAINRGEPALAVSVGLHATCRAATGQEQFRFSGGGRSQTANRAEIAAQAQYIQTSLDSGNHPVIRALASDDYFAPAKYVLASALGEDLPDGIALCWESQIPESSGLGSGGAAFTALAAILSTLRSKSAPIEERANWAHRGDIVAHGGIASALDTQTSLLGGAIQYVGASMAKSVPCAPGLTLVIGHTGVRAATSEVNGSVREWLSVKTRARLAPLRSIGALSRAALPTLAVGDWGELGRLMTMNQLALAAIGVSCSQADSLIDAALEAGALGAKVSGSGGGGIIIALATPDTRDTIAAAINSAGGTAYTPEVCIPGVMIGEQTQQ